MMIVTITEIIPNMLVLPRASLLVIVLYVSPDPGLVFRIVAKTTRSTPRIEAKAWIAPLRLRVARCLLRPACFSKQEPFRQAQRSTHYAIVKITEVLVLVAALLIVPLALVMHLIAEPPHVIWVLTGFRDVLIDV